MLDANTGTESLARELRHIGLIGAGILVAGFLLIGVFQAWPVAVQWLVQAGLLWALVYRQTRKRLDLNRPALHAPLYDRLGWGNRITILRGGLIALAGGFLFLQPEYLLTPWLPAGFYMSAAIIDRVDGYIARRCRQVSLLGGELDTVFDALGLVVAPVLAVGLGKTHWSYLSVSLAYYLFQWGLAYRRRHHKPVFELTPNFLRRTLAGFQMGYMAVALWPVIDPTFSTIAGVAFMLPLLAGFVVDWLTVSGRLQRTEAAAMFFSRLEVFSCHIFQPGLRLLLVSALAFVVADSGATWWPMLGPGWHEQVLSVVLLGSVFMIALGVQGRLGALFLVVLLGWRYPGGDAASLAGWLLVLCIVWIMLLGPGRFSLWRWDDHWVNRHDGA